VGISIGLNSLNLLFFSPASLTYSKRKNMKKLLHIILISLFSLILTSCADKEEEKKEGPVLTEVYPVTTPTSDPSPNYTFSSTKAGTITYGGSCSSGTTSATSGRNTITFTTLSAGTYSDCTIIVTDSDGNASNTLAVTTFVVDTTTTDTTAPTVISVSTTADNQSAVSITDNITVTFSEAMDYTSITTNIDNSSCYGTLMVSSDNFSNCVQMASPNKALDFDGTNDYVDVGDFSLGGSLTFEAWMQYDSRGTWSRIFDFGENGADDDNIWLGLAGSSGTIRFEILSGSSKSMVTDGDGEHTAYGQVPIDGTWIHVAATISGTAGSANGTGKLIVNGNLVGTKTNMYVPAVMTRNNQYLGKSNWGGDAYLNAKMDEFRIWNVARTQAEIQANMNKELSGSETGLVAYYKMNDGSGTSLADSSSNSYTATLNNMTDSDWIQGNASFSDSPSSSPASSNDNMTFTLNPTDNLTGGTTYLTRVTTGVKDASGNAMSIQYETSNGFTTASSGTLMGGSIQGIELSLSTAVTTLAGSSQGSTDGTGTSARFDSPRGITTDGTNLYVSDTGNNRIRKIVIDNGTVTTLAGSSSGFLDNATGTSARFNNPMGITTDGTNLYVADYDNHRIRKIVISTGVVTTLAGGSSSGSTDNATGTSASFNNPHGITTDGTNLYVADYLNHRIRKIVIDNGTVTTLAGQSDNGSTDATGTSASFNRPGGIILVGSNLYVTDVHGHKIRKIIISTGVVTTFAGSTSFGSADGTGTSARFKHPTFITSDGTNLYVTDGGNHTIRKIVISTGVVSTLAGSAGSSGSADGTGTSARFSSPHEITSDGTNLYVADRNNHKIRKIE
jgi:hypothetical protein